VNGRRLAAWVAAASVTALCVIALLVPSTTAGYIASIRNSTNTAGTAPYFTCSGADALTADGANARFVYKLNEASGSVVAGDSASGLLPGTYVGSMTTSTTTPIACPRDGGSAYVLNGSTSYVSAGTLLPINAPTVFSTEVWFKSTVPSGKLFGFGNQATGASGQYDRHVYFSTTGQLIFGIYNSGYHVVTSPSSYTDGVWHLMDATFSSTAGMALYVDGALVGSDPTTTVGESHTGYWRIGYDNLSGWPNSGSNYFFTGSMRFAAVYNTALTAAQVANHYAAGRP
jgi:hypothetical protein